MMTLLPAALLLHPSYVACHSVHKLYEVHEVEAVQEHLLKALASTGPSSLEPALRVPSLRANDQAFRLPSPLSLQLKTERVSPKCQLPLQLFLLHNPFDVRERSLMNFKSES